MNHSSDSELSLVFDKCWIWFLSVPEVQATPKSPPALITPLQDILVSEGHPAQLQCTVSGEGSDAF